MFPGSRALQTSDDVDGFAAEMFNEARTDFGILICSTTIGSLLLSFGLRYSLGIGAPSEMCGNGEEGAEEDHLLICCLCCLALRSYNTLRETFVNYG